MASQPWHLGISIDRPAGEVYAYVSDPANLAEWAAGLGSSFLLVDGQWFADSSMGRVRVAFAALNAYGVLDHEVTLRSGATIYNPMRVIPDGDACEVVFTVRRRPGMSYEDFSRDTDAVNVDLAKLKELLERDR